VSYWDVHPGIYGMLLLLAFLCFPRLSLLFTVAKSFGFVSWGLWLFFPSIVVAMHAASLYWPQNPILVTIAILWVAVKAVIFAFKLLSMIYE
jgi:hypothetical protein